MKSHWNSRKRIEKLDQQLLIIHGKQDRLIPVEMGRKLYAAAPSKDKTILVVPRAGHNDLWRRGVLQKVWAFTDAQRPSAEK